MSLEYAENRIKEALKLAKGNPAKARQQIIAWAMEDSQLLFALAKPHLSGIVAYNIERVASGRADSSRQGQGGSPAPKAAPEAAAPRPGKKPEQFGLEILKAVAGNPAIFGLEDTGAMKKASPVSQRHVDAIRAIATKKTPPKN